MVGYDRSIKVGDTMVVICCIVFRCVVYAVLRARYEAVATWSSLGGKGILDHGC